MDQGSVRPRVAELGHVGLRCHDLGKQLDFYTRVLGLTVTDHDAELGIYFLSARPDVEHHELLLSSGRTVPADGALIQQISFRCPLLSDVIGFYRRMREEGVRFDMIVSHGNAVGVYYFDPEGNRSEVYWQTGLSARQPFVKRIDLEQDPEQLIAEVQRSVREYGSTGYTEPSYLEWTRESGSNTS